MQDQLVCFLGGTLLLENERDRERKRSSKTTTSYDLIQLKIPGYGSYFFFLVPGISLVPVFVFVFFFI